jgi:ATP-binding cassette subfamily C (CFTR/MRP) protein 4
MAGAAFFVCILRSIFFYWFSLSTTKYLHEKMLSSVMNTKIRFFDLNPIGRIMNRFSKDIGSLDDVLPITLFDFCQVCYQFDLNFYGISIVYLGYFGLG